MLLPPHQFAAPQFCLGAENVADVTAREALLDCAMGKRRKRKSSEAIRRGRVPADGLALAAHDMQGRLIGTVRLWLVDAGGCPALLLGPLAVAPDVAGQGVGSALMNLAIGEAAARGHRAILLVGDPAYYVRFGFTAERTGALSMPGPYEKHRLLALELQSGALDGAEGVITGTGPKARQAAADRRRAA